MKKGSPKKTLGEVCQFRGGGTPSKSVERYWLGDIPWVSPKDVKSAIVLDSIDHISQEAIDGSATSLIPKDAVIMVVRSGILARTVPIAITGRALTINQDLKALCPNGAMDARFLYHLLESKMDVLLAMVSRGATVHRLMTEQIRALDFILPPLVEQQRIVGVLDEAFAGLASAQAHAAKNLQNARALFESHLQSVFTHRGKGWVEKPLGELCDILDSRRRPITKRDRTSGDYPYYGATGIVDYVSDFIFDEPLVLVGEDGAKWGAGENTAFRVEGKCWVNNHAHVLSPNRTTVLDNWIVNYLVHSDLTEFVSGLTVPKLNQGNLREIRIPVPSLAEQQRLVAKLDTLATETQRLESLYAQKQTALAALKRSLLHQAFTGNL